MIKISKKLYEDFNEKTILTTKYDDSLAIHRNTLGRPVDDWDNIDNTQLLHKIKNKKSTLLKKARQYKRIAELNKFDYLVTIPHTNSVVYRKTINRLKKADNDIKYISRASWSDEFGLHYHLMIATKLTQAEIKQKIFAKSNEQVKPIPESDQKDMFNYLSNTNNKSTFKALDKPLDINTCRDVVIEILRHKAIYTKSKNLIEPRISKIENEEDVDLEGYGDGVEVNYTKYNRVITSKKHKKI